MKKKRERNSASRLMEVPDMKNKSQLLLMAVPSLIIARFTLSFTLLSTGNPFIDFLLPAMPIIGGILGVFQSFLVPLGRIFGSAIQGIVQLIPGRGPTGYAVYFMVFAAIFILAIGLNVIWRPRGYATTKSKIKKETKEAKKQEKTTKKAEASRKYQEVVPEEPAKPNVSESTKSKIKKETKEAKKQEKTTKKAEALRKYQEIAPEEPAKPRVPEPVKESEIPGKGNQLETRDEPLIIEEKPDESKESKAEETASSSSDEQSSEEVVEEAEKPEDEAENLEKRDDDNN